MSGPAAPGSRHEEDKVEFPSKVRPKREQFPVRLSFNPLKLDSVIVLSFLDIFFCEADVFFHWSNNDLSVLNLQA